MNLFHLPLTSPATLTVVDVVAALLVIVMLTRPKRRERAWTRHVVIAVVAGSAVGGTAVWFIGDVLNAFDVAPTWVDRVATSAMVAGVCLGVVNLVFAHAGRRVVAVVGIVAVVLAGALAINRDVGEFPRLGDALGVVDAGPLTLPHPTSAATVSHDPDLWRHWSPPAIMPAQGRVGTVTIPATVSHFDARPALVYLPPAALVASAPALPVVILMSGQPGSPLSVMTAGHVPRTLNEFARENQGLAPIVVVPDQLGSASANPMCVDGELGESATYLTVDVPAWIRSHLHVETGATSWAIGGFSQGATCALQFATELPNEFGSLIDVSGQQYPTLSTDRAAIATGFGGSRAAFEAAKPETIMRAHGPYRDSFAFFAAGEKDTRFVYDMGVMSGLAAQYGMVVSRDVEPRSGHDWTTASSAFRRAFGLLYPRLGLAQHAQSP